MESALTNKPTKLLADDRQRGIGVFELLFAAATVGTAILFAALSEPKIPRGQAD